MPEPSGKTSCAASTSSARHGKRATAIPGGGTGKNSAYLFRTAGGYSAAMKEGREMSSAPASPYNSNGDSDPVSAIINETGTITGTSIFDPVLCELVYRWFCPPGGVVLDPFAGGSVRGIVASALGRHYVGIDLRPEQVAANRAQADALCRDQVPVWHEGDSRDLAPIVGDIEADFVFSCPPYADLERYSDDARDLSTMAYGDFLDAYRAIIAATCAKLRPDRFACFVVGDVRDKGGLYYGFPRHTIDAFEAAGLRLYNDAVLVTAVGSLPVRAGKQFASTRKLGKTHQNVLVFVKGDPRKASDAVGPVEFGDLPESDPEMDEIAAAAAAFDERL